MGNFRGGFGGGGMQMQQLMKQAQKMQEEMMKKQEELENSVVSASSGGGMVNIELNGKKEVVSLKINPDIVDRDDTEMLEDLIVACFNEASNKIDKLKNDTMGNMGGLPF
ncbi:MAG: YbaB/EbfC family nucleoid-associated protein [Clostridiales bacterium]|nr:YbaB/EbfC family nucleoid-associated protein [Clostridiales bacterium]